MNNTSTYNLMRIAKDFSGISNTQLHVKRVYVNLYVNESSNGDIKKGGF